MPRKDRRQKNCSQVPSLVSAFVDAFIDYVVGGQFLPTQQSESVNTSDKSFNATSGGPTEVSGNEKRQDGPDLPTRIPAPKRLIAIGDLHGDLLKTLQAFMIAGVMDRNEQWIGGDTVVVQVGDLLDRGGSEIKIIYLLEKLKGQAQRQGGDVHIMTGNHEILNVEGDLRYVTPEGLAEFKRWGAWYADALIPRVPSFEYEQCRYTMGNVLKERCQGLTKPYDFFKDIPDEVKCKVPGGCKVSDGCKARIAALRPGGPISSRFLAFHPAVLVVGTTVFVHGGLWPAHVRYGLERMNHESKEWLQGKNQWLAPSFYRGDDAVVWLRDYARKEEEKCQCDKLEQALGAITGAKRMVMGHTIQINGINAVCGNKAVRVDVGMSKGCDDSVAEVLEIQNDNVMIVLSASSPRKTQAKEVGMEDSEGSSDSKRRGDADSAPFLFPTSPTAEVPNIEPVSLLDKLKRVTLLQSSLTPPTEIRIPYPTRNKGGIKSPTLEKSKNASPVGAILESAKVGYMLALQRLQDLVGPAPIPSRMKQVSIMGRDIADVPKGSKRARSPKGSKKPGTGS